MIAFRAAAVAVLAALFGLASATQGAELRPFDAASVAAIRATHAGRPYVLAFWSIHCAPCLEDMGAWRALMTKHPQVPIILVTTDPQSDRRRVAQVLAEYKLEHVENWAFADEFEERVRFAVDRTWRGELPRTYFHDAAHRSEVKSGRVDVRWADDWFSRQRK
jgi:thiol-disulfide isomerase/thioredoxin